MKHHIVIYHRNAVQPEIAFRAGEAKLGEHLYFLEPGESLLDLKSYAQKGIRFALLGIPESIGVEANFGKCCTDNAWPVFLNFFLNIQSNRFLKGNNILCLGHIDTRELNQAAASLDRTRPDSVQQMRALCSRLDDRVSPVIEKIVRTGLIPVIIGGGHNNAYPIIKGTARALGATQGINCINCDKLNSEAFVISLIFRSSCKYLLNVSTKSETLKCSFKSIINHSQLLSIPTGFGLLKVNLGCTLNPWV